MREDPDTNLIRTTPDCVFNLFLYLYIPLSSEKKGKNIESLE